MLDHPDRLLGRLQRGRGDAVRELLRMPVEPASKILVACLCTEGDLGQHDEGIIELVVALSPDLSPWYRWIETLAPDAAEETRLYAFNMLGRLAVLGHAGARGFLDGYVIGGCHWRDALSQYLVDGLDLDRAAWSQLLPRVDDKTLALHVHCKGAQPLWASLAVEDQRVDSILRAQRDRRAPHQGVVSWSVGNYACAPLSQTRWKVLESLLRQDPGAAVPFLIDGLWDGSHFYRDRCIARCDLDWPGVRERLAQLAAMAGSRSAAAARRRLDGSEDEKHVIQAKAMDERDFWVALEFRVTREMAGLDECRRCGMWCDGFIAHAFDFDAMPNRVHGRVWVGLGPRHLEAWTFELLLPVPAASRDEIRWSDLLPAENATRWLNIDHDGKHLIVAPGDAVDDAS